MTSAPGHVNDLVGQIMERLHSSVLHGHTPDGDSPTLTEVLQVRWDAAGRVSLLNAMCWTVVTSLLFEPRKQLWSALLTTTQCSAYGRCCMQVSVLDIMLASGVRAVLTPRPLHSGQSPARCAFQAQLLGFVIRKRVVICCSACCAHTCFSSVLCPNWLPCDPYQAASCPRQDLERDSGNNSSPGAASHEPTAQEVRTLRPGDHSTMTAYGALTYVRLESLCDHKSGTRTAQWLVATVYCFQ